MVEFTLLGVYIIINKKGFAFSVIIAADVILLGVGGGGDVGVVGILLIWGGFNFQVQPVKKEQFQCRYRCIHLSEC